MKNKRQVLQAVLVAILSIVIIIGSMAIALIEGGRRVAIALTPTTPTETHTPSPIPPVISTRAGEPTFTPSPTPLPTFTPSPTTTPTFPPPLTTCPPPEGWISINIAVDDTLESLAQTYGTTPEMLATANCLITNGLLPGTILYVPMPPPIPTATNVPVVQCGPPAGWVLYTVQKGDTLYSLGLAYGVTVAQLQTANCLGSSTIIRAGNQIYIPNVPTRTPIASATASTTASATTTPTVPATHTPTDLPTPTNTIPPSDTPLPPSPTQTAVPSTATPMDTNTPTPDFTPTP